MAEIKGILLSAWMDFLKSRYGWATVVQTVETLPLEDRLLLTSPFLPSSWYSYRTLHALRKLTRPLAGHQDGNMSVEIGRFMAEYVFTGVYRTLLAKDPIKQVNKFESIKDFFFREARTLETEITGEKTCLVRYRYEPGATPTRAICESLTGFWSRTLELAGASGVKCTHPKCVAKKAPFCEFAFSWEGP